VALVNNDTLKKIILKER